MQKMNCSHLEESNKDKQMLSNSPVNYPFYNFELPQSMSLVLLMDDLLLCLAPSSLHCFHGNTSETLLLSEEMKRKVAGISECLNIKWQQQKNGGASQTLQAGYICNVC